MKKTFEPKKGEEGLVIAASIGRRQVDVDEDGGPVFDREPGEVFEVGGEQNPWPYSTDNPNEIALLEAHDQVKHGSPKASSKKKGDK
ncbi:MAG: hypothetical protein KY393_06390 [Actinobacteria bacterium]|nr:hypothetical protein [Actinomycetota bacterium]